MKLMQCVAGEPSIGCCLPHRASSQGEPRSQAHYTPLTP